MEGKQRTDEETVVKTVQYGTTGTGTYRYRGADQLEDSYLRTYVFYVLLPVQCIFKITRIGVHGVPSVLF